MVGQVMISTGGNLPCTRVVHAVGPHWDDYTDKNLCQQALIDTVYNCLCTVSTLGLVSVAIPSISAQRFKVPADICAKSYLTAVNQYELSHGATGSLRYISFVDVDNVMVLLIQDTFKRLWNDYLGSGPSSMMSTKSTDDQTKKGQESSPVQAEKTREISPPERQQRSEDCEKTATEVEEAGGSERRSQRSRTMTEKGRENRLATKQQNFSTESRALIRVITKTTSQLDEGSLDVDEMRQRARILKGRWEEFGGPPSGT